MDSADKMLILAPVAMFISEVMLPWLRLHLSLSFL
jgi:hypothetical protein